MYSTYSYPSRGIDPRPIPSANLGPTNQVNINGPFVGDANGEYINGSFDDKEHAPDMGPTTCPLAAYMSTNSTTRKPYFRGTLIRFGGTTIPARSKARQLETRAPQAFSNFYVPGDDATSVSFVAPLAETQELIPKQSQHVCVAVGGVTDVLVPAESPTFTVFPGDKLYVNVVPKGVFVTPQVTNIVLGVASHYHTHTTKKQSIVRVCLK